MTQLKSILLRLTGVLLLSAATLGLRAQSVSLSAESWRFSGKEESLSPYNYCAGNPIIFVDGDGKLLGDPVKDPMIELGIIKIRKDGTEEFLQIIF